MRCAEPTCDSVCRLVNPSPKSIAPLQVHVSGDAAEILQRIKRQSIQ